MSHVLLSSDGFGSMLWTFLCSIYDITDLHYQSPVLHLQILSRCFLNLSLLWSKNVKKWISADNSPWPQLK